MGASPPEGSRRKLYSTTWAPTPGGLFRGKGEGQLSTPQPGASYFSMWCPSLSEAIQYPALSVRHYRYVFTLIEKIHFIFNDDKTAGRHQHTHAHIHMCICKQIIHPFTWKPLHYYKSKFSPVFLAVYRTVSLLSHSHRHIRQ